MRPASLLALLLLPVAFAPLPARGAPGWAGKPDTADAAGHLFVCSGEGKNEQDALDSALALCNDKICKLCGVEVESTTVTKETLTGVDLQRKVVERCRRVRKVEPQLRAKSLECEEGRCQAFVQLFYSTEAEKAECASYAREDFADPAACEADIEAFRRQEGIAAASFRARAGQLDAAQAHCAQIDVRPTPALLALDEKLRIGIGKMQPAGRYQDRVAESFLGSYGPTLQAIAETKTLLGRLQLAGALVANKVLVMELVEASTADDVDSAAGVVRLVATGKAAPIGSSYGAPDPHLPWLRGLLDFKSDTTALADFLRGAYQPEKPPEGMRDDGWSLVAIALAADRRVTPAEWDWGLRATRARLCSTCLGPLLVARDHGGAGVRLARWLEGVKELRAAFGSRSSRKEYGIYQLLPMGDPDFALQAEEAAPAEWKPFFDFELYGHLSGSFNSRQPLEEQQRLLQRRAEKAALPGRDGDACRELGRRLEALQREEAPRVAPLDQAVCACLDGALAAEERQQKKEVLQYALDGKLACVEAP